MKILSKAKGNHGLLELDSSSPQTVTGTVYFDNAYFNNVPFVDVDNVSVQLATLNSLSVTTNTKEGVHIATLKWGLIEYELYAPVGGTTDLTNYMTLNTEQTVTGVKTFGTIRASKIWGAANNSTFVDFSNDEDTIIGASGCIVLRDEVQLGSTYQYGFRPDGAGTLLSLTLTDALPIASGGTGATTADSARTNLGLGSAATYAVASSVTPTGAGLTTSKAVYDALGMYYTTSQVDNLLGSYVLSSALGSAATKSTTTSVTSGSSSLVTSGGVYSWVTGKNYLTSVYDDTIQWGNTVLTGDYIEPPLVLNEYVSKSANVLSYMDTSQIQVEYSTDGGLTWTDYGASDETKTFLTLAGKNTSLYLGKSTAQTVSCKLRVTISASSSQYCQCAKLFIESQTAGSMVGSSSGLRCKVEKAQFNAPSTFTNVGTYTLKGYPGTTVIPFNYRFGVTGTYVSSIRFTFDFDSISSSYPNGSKAAVRHISMLSKADYAVPNDTNRMWTAGRLYNYDYQKNAIFPKNITANGNIIATGTVTQGSDFFRKNILEDVLFTVEDIAAAPLVKFQWNDMPEDSSVHIGSIAQYWQKILPEAIHGKAGESLAMEYQTIALGSSIITAREVVKLKEEINALKQRVKELEGSE